MIFLVMSASALDHFLWLVSTAALFAFSVSDFEAAGIEPLEVSHREDKEVRACNPRPQKPRRAAVLKYP